MSVKEKYTVILPTYNERKNLPISTLLDLLVSYCARANTYSRSHLDP